MSSSCVLGPQCCAATIRTGHLEPLHIAAPDSLLVAGEPLDPAIVWVRPELVAELRLTGWTSSSRIGTEGHAVYLGLREDKNGRDVVRDVADPQAS